MKYSVYCSKNVKQTQVTMDATELDAFIYVLGLGF